MIFTRSAGSSIDLIPPRTSRPGRAPATSSLSAMRQSVIWAATNLHASLEAMMPVNVYRMIEGIKFEVPPPPVLVNPSEFAEGHPESLAEWLRARRVSLMIWGNCFGEITSRDNLNLPAKIQLVPVEDVTCKVKDYRIVEYRFGKTVVEPRKVWHERSGNLMPGNPIGLSPIAFAMLAIETSAAARYFAAEWFGNQAYPGGHLKNDNRALKRGEAETVKAKFKRDVAAGDLFVTGSDWTFNPIQAKAVEAGFMDAMAYGDVELCRFHNTPANIIDVATTGTARITYANITQANLDFMVTRMGPDLAQTDAALSSLTARPRFVKLTREALLAMDPVTRNEMLAAQVDARLRTPSELRVLDDKQPYTDADYAEFDRLFGSKNLTPTPKVVPA